MRALTRKLLRDLWHLKGQATAIALVVASGVAVLVMSMSTLESLRLSQATYYERYRFANVFARLKRAPEPLAARVAEIPGVARVETRVVADVVLDVEGMAEPAVGRLVSIPERPTAHLNALYLRRGRDIEPGHPDEVLVSEAFADANRLEPGDSVSAVVNGRWTRLAITGVALSPEYVYQIRGGDLLPDDRHFGVFWMGRDALEAALDMDGAFNDISVTLTRGASEDEVIDRLDRLLDRYGGRALGRDDQPSHRYLASELAELRGSGLVIPPIFLGVAAFLLNVVLARLVGTQRGQIATLKAFGYSNGAIALHYLELVSLIVLVGAALGVAAGIWLGIALTEMYTRFFRFPVLEFRLDPGTTALAVLVSGAASLAGGVGAVRRVAALPPAAAMQPEPPARFRPTIVERLGFHRWLSPPGRMILRNLERRPFRAFVAVLAMSLSVAILVVGGASGDAVRFILDVQFTRAQRDDVTVTLADPRSSRVRQELAHLPGVTYVEPFRAVPATLRSGHRTYRTAVLGLPSNAELRRLVDRELRVVRVPPEGAVLTTQLAEMLRVGRGDLLTIEALEGARPIRTVVVADLVDELVGVSAYMNLRALNRLMREQEVVSGAFLSVDPLDTGRLYRRLKATPGVAGVTVREAALATLRQTLAEAMRRVRVVQVVFAVIIAAGVVYNAARIALSERSRELATLRVVGLTRAEISLILLGELALLAALAVPPGLALGYALAALVTLAYRTELFRLPLVVAPSTYAFAAVVVAAAAALSALAVRRRLDRLDLVAVLKARE